MRVGPGGAFALDFGSVMTVGAALGTDLEMLADTLPAVESAIVKAMTANPEDE